MLKSVDLKDYMQRNPVQVSPASNVYDAIHEIMAHRASGACVVDEAGSLLGILSEIDCLRAILSAVYNESPVGLVEEYMTKEVISVRLHDNIVDVAADMLEHKHRRRPVLDEDGKLIGQVTCRQLLGAVKDFASPNDS